MPSPLPARHSDQFIENGSAPILRKKHGLSAENTVAKVLAALGQV